MGPGGHAGQSQASHHQPLDPLKVDHVSNIAQRHHHFATVIERVARIFGIWGPAYVL